MVLFHRRDYNNSIRRTCNEKEKMEQGFVCIFSDGDSRIASVRLWREECGKRRCRNNHSIFMEHKPA